MSTARNPAGRAATPARVTRSMTRASRETTPAPSRTDRRAPGGASMAPPRRPNGSNPQTPLPSIPSRTNTAWGADGSPGLEIPIAVAPNPRAPLREIFGTRSRVELESSVSVITSNRNPRAAPPTISEEAAEDDGIGLPNSQEQTTEEAPAYPGLNDRSDLTTTVNREASLIDRAGNDQHPDPAVPPPPEPSRFRIAWEIVRRRCEGWPLTILIWIIVAYCYREQVRNVALSMWNNLDIPRPIINDPSSMSSIPSSMSSIPSSVQYEPSPPFTSERFESTDPTTTNLISDRTGFAWSDPARMRSLMQDPKSFINSPEYRSMMDGINSRFVPQFTPLAEPGTYERLDKLEKDVAEIRNKLGLHEATVTKLQEILPHEIVVRKNEETGEFEIPDQFWKALSSKITKDYSFKHASNADDWDLFWARNQVKLHKYFESEFDSRLEPFLNGQHVIGQQQFTTMLEQRWKELSAEVREHNTALEAAYRSLQSDILANASRTAKTAASRIAREESYRTVQDAIWSLPNEQLEILARANDIQNAWRAANSINYFSPGLGAIIDPHMTTPTKKKPDTLMQSLYKWLSGIPRANKPLKALERWDEATDCWCGAGIGNDGLGRVQLGVLMKHKLWPRKVTIEHISSDGTLDIGAAPKDMELWVEIDDPALRSTVKNAIQLQGLVCQGGFAGRFVCLGTMSYDVHGLNNVQTFPLDVDLKLLGVEDGVRNAVVRVLNNWGRDYTCVYRVRMHGELAKPEESLK